MSQLLNGVVKALVCKKILRHNNGNMVRWCSSMPIYPYMVLDRILNLACSGNRILNLACLGKDYLNGRIAIGKYSCLKEIHIVIKDVELEKEVRNAMTLGYYNGWFKRRVTFTNDDPRINIAGFGVPPCPKGSVIQSIAMTSYLDLKNEDWVLAIKLYGCKIKLYRRTCKPRWINVKAMPQSIYTSSSLMYSKKDQRFYLPTPGSNFLFSLDLDYKENDHPEFIGLWTEDLSRHYKGLDLDEIRWNFNTVHFVEAPSGEQFLVKWFFYDGHQFENELTQVTSRTSHLVVFRVEDHPLQKKEKKLFYTDDIGDLCIFLGYGEPFCVRASSHPGLHPSCIYFAGYNFGVYDITTKYCTIFFTKEGPMKSSKLPFWHHP